MKNIVKELLRLDARKEALEILELANEHEKKQFVDYWDKKQENVCCLVLDSIKMRLVKEGKMTYSEKDAFGHNLFK